MGLVKTIYNVLGGFYMDYNSTNPIKSVHKLNKSLHLFLCTFSSPILSLSIFHKNMHKKTRFFIPGFVFAQKVLQILLWKSFLSLKEALHRHLTPVCFPK